MNLMDKHILEVPTAEVFNNVVNVVRQRNKCEHTYVPGVHVWKYIVAPLYLLRAVRDLRIPNRIFTGFEILT